MLSRLEFNQLLDKLGTTTSAKAERLQAIDIYDIARKKSGRFEAQRQLRAFIEKTKFIQKKNNLISIADQIPDFSAKNRIKKIVNDGDEEQITKLSEKLSTKIIIDSIRASGLTEEKIRTLAAPYSTSDKPTGHLRARRWLRSEAKRATARLNMNLGLISAHTNPHATPYEILLRNQQKDRWKKFGENTKLSRTDEETGEVTELLMSDVMSTANKKKLSEIYTLTKGLEKYAKSQGLVWSFITLTAPPEMHPNPSRGANSWDGTEPDAAHKWIHAAWRRTEARMRKAGIIVSGVRVCEPHQDGCPHWHTLIFSHAEQVHKIEECLRYEEQWQLKTESKDPESGCKIVSDNGAATAASYLFKYVLKSVNSIEKLDGEAASIDAWRSTWSIRSFQWMGMPPVGLWRRLRDIKTQPLDTSLVAVWQAAQAGNAEEFIRLSGGLNIKAKDRPLHSKTETSAESRIKTIVIENRELLTTTSFSFKKFEQFQVENAKVAVIHNYPSEKQNTETDKVSNEKSPPWIEIGFNQTATSLNTKRYEAKEDEDLKIIKAVSEIEASARLEELETLFTEAIKQQKIDRGMYIKNRLTA